MRAVLYARTSTDDTERGSLEAQIGLCRDYAEGHGYQVMAAISESERGASGVDIDLPGLQRVLDMAANSQFDVLVIREVDRLSRDLLKQLLVERELQKHGVGIEFVVGGGFADTPEGRLQKHVLGVLAQFEREQLQRRTERGKLAKVKAGSVACGGRPPYGYRKVKQDGKTLLEVEQEQAQAVHLVFDLYTQDRLAVHAIARKLETLQVPTSADIHGMYKQRGRYAWNSSVVYKMLRNETYVGRWRYKHRTGDIVVPVPAIISPEQFAQAQALLGSNKANARRNMKRQYLMSKRVVCGVCGLRMTGHTVVQPNKEYQYYRCGSKTGEKARTCNLPMFRVDVVDAVCWAWAVDLLTNPEALQRGLALYREQLEAQEQPTRDRLKTLERNLVAQRQRLDRLLDLYLDGMVDKETFAERKQGLEEKIASLEVEQAELQGLLSADMATQEQMSVYLADIAHGLDLAQADFATQRKIIEALDMTATLDLDENGEKVATVTCLLGNIRLYPGRPVLEWEPGIRLEVARCDIKNWGWA